MNQTPFIRHLPLLFKVGTSLNIHTAELNVLLVFLRVVATVTLAVFTIWSFYGKSFGLESFCKFHDIFVTIVIIVNEITLIINKKTVAKLAKTLLEPLPSYKQNTAHFKAIEEYLTVSNKYDRVIVFMFISSFLWSLSPLLGLIRTKNDESNSSFSTLFEWIPDTTDSYGAVLVIYCGVVFVVVSGIVYFFCFYPMIVYAVLRIKLMFRLLVLDLAVLDENASLICEDRMEFLIATSRLPLCPICRKPEQTNEVKIKGNIVRVEDAFGNLVVTRPSRSRNCCVNACRKEFLLECYQGCVREIVQEHVKIMKLVTLVDEGFRLTVMLYNQSILFAIVLAIPNIGSLNDLSAKECLIISFEVIAVLACIAFVSHCGQTVLNESEQLRLAIAECCLSNYQHSVIRSLRIMLTVANKPLRLTSGSINTLSMESYATILSATYSYASLLQSFRIQNGDNE